MGKSVRDYQTTINLLKDVVYLLDHHDIEYCLHAGTLLQLYRDGCIADHDLEDLDIAIFEPFFQDMAIWKPFCLDLEKIGIEIDCVADGRYVCLRRDGVHCDFYLMVLEGSDYIVEVTGMRQTYPERLFFPFKQLEVDNYCMNIPNKCEIYFRLVYGADWSIPKGYNEFTHQNAVRINNFKKINYNYILSVPE